jgi:hypothetical protein
VVLGLAVLYYIVWSRRPSRDVRSKGRG